MEGPSAAVRLCLMISEDSVGGGVAFTSRLGFPCAVVLPLWDKDQQNPPGLPLAGQSRESARSATAGKATCLPLSSTHSPPESPRSTFLPRPNVGRIRVSRQAGPRRRSWPARLSLRLAPSPLQPIHRPKPGSWTSPVGQVGERTLARSSAPNWSSREEAAERRQPDPFIQGHERNGLPTRATHDGREIYILPQGWWLCIGCPCRMTSRWGWANRPSPRPPRPCVSHLARVAGASLAIGLVARSAGCHAC